MISVIVQFLVHHQRKESSLGRDALRTPLELEEEEHIYRKDVVGFLIFLLFVFIVSLIVAYG